MPIRPYLSDGAFDPEAVAEMSFAMESVREALSLRAVDDVATRLVAMTIIELAGQGLRGPALQTAALDAFPQAPR
jgi:hypothetical protein